MADPDFIYDPDDWEYTWSWDDRQNATDDTIRYRLGEWKRFETLIQGPEKIAAYVLKQDAKDESDIELRWFDSEEEAKRACELRPATFTEAES